ncbi:MAG: cytochrome P450 [Actinomycetota bacterium]
MTRAPGPTVRQALRTLRSEDLLTALLALHQEHGDVAGFRYGRKAWVAIRDPEHIEHVLVARNDNYTKSYDYRLLAVVTGRGLLTNEGAAWAGQRRLIQPMFAGRHLSRFAGDMTAAAATALDRWERTPDGSRIDVAEEMSVLTLDVVGRALFGADLGAHAGRIAPAVTVGLRTAITFARVPFMWLVPQRLINLGAAILFRFPIPRLRRIHRSVTTLDDVAVSIIDSRIERDEEHDDLLGLLLAARDPDTGERMSKRQIRDELMTFLLAGHETTANGLAWMWYLLSSHPEARERMSAEADAVLGDRTPTADDATRLPWTAACFQEAMRLYPPAWILERDAIGPDEVGGFEIPRRATVVISPYVVHRNPAVWKDPDVFDPERFLPGAAAGRPRSAYLPFGAGRRMCVGAGFAMMEGTLLAAMIARRFTLDLVPGADVVPEPTATLRPRDGLPMILRRRDAAAP